MEETKTFTKKYDYLTKRLDTPCGIAKEGEALKMAWLYGQYIAIWDTGCAMTTVKSSLLKSLGLESKESISINTVSGTTEHDVYYVDLLLPGGFALKHHKVIAGEQNACDVLVGMDVITMGDFAVTNLNGETTFTFRVPSECVIDFHAEQHGQTS